jgi:RsiW-degrading membrane proteinase PrsW (M82 family)
LAVLAYVIVLIAVMVILIVSPREGLLFILAIAPSSFLLWHFYNADKYKHESMRLIRGTFLLGAVSVIPAYFIEIAFTEPSPDAGFLAVFAYFVLCIGLVEELMKFLSVRIYAYRSKEFDEPMDGIVFGVAAALGFATVENILYVFSSGVFSSDIWVAAYRAVVSVPAHAFYGAIMGFYLGEAKMRGRPLLALEGLMFAALLHGLFDTLATVTSVPITALVTLPALVWIIYFKVVKKEIAEAEAESPYRP